MNIIPKNNIIKLKMLLNGMKKWKKIEIKLKKNKPKNPVSPKELFNLSPNMNFLKTIPYPRELK
tara:strand:- start:213 stop:404 length:192 start_codon:yes stop_codon:yes gene_type:complete